MSLEEGKALVSTVNLYKYFNVSGGLLDQITFEGGLPQRKIEYVKALNGIDLHIQPGEISA